MKIKVLLAAIAAGMLAGVLMTPLQATKVIPLIIQAEMFEAPAHAAPAAAHQHGEAASSGSNNGAVNAGVAGAPSDHAHAEMTGATSDAPLLLGRIWNTVLANLVTGAGYGLLMAGVSMACGVNVTVASGLIWGALGWLCVQLLPALGLAPELPGFPHIDLDARQYWWVFTVAASVTGFWFALLASSKTMRAVGAALLVAPHVYGAPQPSDIASAVPAYLASQYAVATLSTMLFFWLVLGLALGWFMDRMKLQQI